MIEQIDHINLVVRDLPAMTAFYRDVLGCRVTNSATISGSWIDDVVGLRDVIADVVYLDLPAGPRVELIQYQSPVGDQLPPNSISNTLGIRHVAFRVSDIDQLVVLLREAGAQVGSQIATVPLAQVIYSGGARKRLVYFRDPEGNLLELCEYKA